MKQYLNWLHDQYGDNFALVLDDFSAHREEKVKEHAQKLKIQLLFVPACSTG